MIIETRELLKTIADVVSFGTISRVPEVSFPDQNWEKFACDAFLMRVEQMMRGMTFNIVYMSLNVFNDGCGGDDAMLSIETGPNKNGVVLDLTVEPERYYIGNNDGIEVVLTHKPTARIVVREPLSWYAEAGEFRKHHEFFGLTPEEAYMFYNRVARHGDEWETVSRELGFE